MSFEWIKESGKLSAEKTPEKLKDFVGCKYYCCFVDKELCGGILQGNESFDFAKLLEMRVFNETKEFRIHRTNLEDDFYFRVADDETLQPENYFDEEQLLDIDSSRSGNDILFATGGGCYTLPLEDGEDAVVIRNYLNYSETTGRAKIDDYRIVKFKKSEGDK